MEELLTLLKSLGITYERFDHKAVFTCEESEGLGIEIPGAHTKQLLMKGKRTDKILLAIVMHDKRVDTKTLAKECNEKSFSFASEELMMELLGVTPGSVTPLGLTHDKDHRIEILIDEDAWNMGTFRFHPMTNTATLSMKREDFEKFLKNTGHSFTVRKIPQRID